MRKQTYCSAVTRRHKQTDLADILIYLRVKKVRMLNNICHERKQNTSITGRYKLTVIDELGIDG